MLEFSPLERKIYDSLYSDAKKDFEHLTEKGLVSRNYTHILAMLMRYVMFLLLVLFTMFRCPSTDSGERSCIPI